MPIMKCEGTNNVYVHSDKRVGTCISSALTKNPLLRITATIYMASLSPRQELCFSAGKIFLIRVTSESWTREIIWLQFEREREILSNLDIHFFLKAIVERYFHSIWMFSKHTILLVRTANSWVPIRFMSISSIFWLRLRILSSIL